jgi:hypothetical protein
LPLLALNIFPATAKALGPDIRTTPIPAQESAVEMAAIVVCMNHFSQNPAYAFPACGGEKCFYFLFLAM